MRALLVLLLTTTAAFADHEAFMGSHLRALRTDSANALTEKSLVGPTAGYGYRLPVTLAPKLELWGTARISSGFATDEMFQTLETDLQTFEIAIGAGARYPLWRRYVFGTAHLDAGPHWVSVRLEDMAHHSAADTSWGVVTSAALGVEAYPLALRRFSLGLRAELGMVMTNAVDIDARAEGGPEGTIELDRMAASLGQLDLSGRYFSMTVTTRF